MDTLQPLHLFDDPTWQMCLESFFEDLARRETHAAYIDHRTILRQFFLGQDPAAISREIVTLFCNSDTIHGKPNYHTATRRRVAIKNFYEYALMRGIHRGDNPARSVEKPRIPHLFDDRHWQMCLAAWLEQLRSPETRSSYTNILLRFYRDPERMPDTYSRAEVEAFVRSAQSSKKHNGGLPVEPSPQTKNARRAALASFYAYAADFQIVGDDKRLYPLMHTLPPTRGVRSEKTAPAHRLISEKDIVALFKTIPSTTAIGIRDRTLFLCYLYLGRRNRELRLLWQDIEPYTFTNKDGDAYEGYRYRYQAKGKPGWQYAELMREVYGQIVWYLTATDRLDSIKPGDGIFVQHFMTPDGKLVGFAKEPLSSSSIRHILKKYARAASLDESACVHAFRHFNAQMRYRCGQGLLEISAAMGHSSIAITHTYLQSLITENDPGAPLLAARLGALLGIE